jgi:hypothetical protein
MLSIELLWKTTYVTLLLSSDEFRCGERVNLFAETAVNSPCPILNLGALLCCEHGSLIVGTAPRKPHRLWPIN